MWDYIVMLHLMNTQAYIQDVSIGFCSTFAIINLRKVILNLLTQHPLVDSHRKLGGGGDLV